MHTLTKAQQTARLDQARRREPLTLAQVQRDHADGRGTTAAKVAMLELIVKRGNVTPEAREWCADQARALASA